MSFLFVKEVARGLEPISIQCPGGVLLAIGWTMATQ